MENDLYIGIVLLVCFAFGVILGGVARTPNELENGCIVHNDKIYCEVVNG